MTIFDMSALAVILICVLVSMMRGAVAEITSLASWVVSFMAARLFAEAFADAFLTSLQPRAVSVAAGFILVFAAAWLVQYLLRSLLSSALAAMGLGSLNRMLGGVFGAVKGILIMTLVVLVCSFTDLPKTQDWRESVSAIYFETLASVAVPYLAGQVTERLDSPLL